MTADSVPIKIGIFVGSIAKRRAYGRSGLATSAILLAPKKNQQNYNWQRYTQQPKQCAASQSHCLSPSSLMCRAKHPRWILSSLRARKFLRRVPRGPRAQCAKIEPGQTYLWLWAARREGRRACGVPSQKSRVLAYLLFDGQESNRPRGQCRANRLTITAKSALWRWD